MMIVHITPDQMIRYINDGLSEAERIQVEQQLAECDCCLQLFMTTIEAAESEVLRSDPHLSKVPLSQIPDMDLLEQRVVEQLMVEQEQNRIQMKRPVEPITLHEKPRRLQTWLQHPLTHYTIAASITLLLLVSGTFSSFSQKLAQHDMNENIQQVKLPSPSTDIGKPSESWSDKIVDQTGSWLDGLKASRFK